MSAGRGVAVLLLTCGVLCAADWQVEVADATGGKFASLRMDSFGNAHVCHLYAPDHLLKYSFWDHGVKKWFSTALDSSSGYCSLALDSKERPRISYIEYGTNRLKYALWDGAVWKKELIRINAKQIDFYTSLTLDHEDKPTIVYYEYWGAGDYFRLHLRMAGWTGSFWEIRTIDSEPGSGKFNNGVSDSSGAPHIAYANVKDESASVRYAHWNGKSWNLEVLEGPSPGYGAYSVAIALDKTGSPHITYTDIQRHIVKYATRRSGKWTIETVDSLRQEAYPDRNGIALDSNGDPYISYFDVGAGLLKLAHREKGKWVVEVVDRNSAGFTSSLAIDGGAVWLTYSDEVNQQLKCARRQLDGITSGAQQRPAANSK